MQEELHAAVSLCAFPMGTEGVLSTPRIGGHPRQHLTPKESVGPSFADTKASLSHCSELPPLCSARRLSGWRRCNAALER